MFRAVGIKGVSAAATVALQLLLARTLGAEGYGEYAIAMAWIMAVSVLTILGLDNASLRFVAEYRARGRLDLLAGFLRQTLRILIIVGIGAACLTLLEAVLLRPWISERLFLFLVFGALSLPAISLTLTWQSALRGLGWIGRGMTFSISRPGIMLMLLVVAFLSGIPLTSPLAMAFHLMAVLLSMAIVLFWNRSVLPDFVGIVPGFEIRKWVVTTLPIFALTALHFFQGQCSVMIGGALLLPEQVGCLAAMLRISSVILMGLNSVDAVAAPRFAAVNATGTKADLQRVASRCALASTAFAAAAGGGILLCGPWIISLIGPEYSGGYLLLTILTLGSLINAVAGSNVFLLTMTGHERDCLVLYIISFASALILNAVLMTSHGAIGAAVAVTLSTAIWNVMMTAMVRFRLGIWSCLTPSAIFRNRQRGERETLETRALSTLKRDSREDEPRRMAG